MTDVDIEAPPTLTRGPSKEEDEAAWFETRRQGVTATELRDLAGRYASTEKRRILIEKVTGERTFFGSQYTDHGNAREPIIAAWVHERFGIEPNDHVYVRGRALATPDGIDPFDNTLAEVKTSKHDLSPGLLDADNVLTPQAVDARVGHFWTTGYYDQVQGQMDVMGSERTLFAWEQHDDVWPDPTPMPLRTCWILRDEARIVQLRAVRDRFLLELDAARSDGLPPTGELDPQVAQDAVDLLEHRTAEAVAKKQKDVVWKRLQAALLTGDDLSIEQGGVRVTVSSTAAEATTYDDDAFREKHPAIHERVEKRRAELEKAEAEFNRLRSRFATTTTTTTKRLTVTTAKAPKEKNA